MREAKEREQAQSAAVAEEQRVARTKQTGDHTARMIVGAGTLAQCDEGLEELAESVNASEDGQEAGNDEVMIRKSPSTTANAKTAKAKANTVM